ncbi:hypothetical protein KUTeg_016387 [Tegillarca granosa]|uniref:Uncharacterized protein n=1 Tax=Tegillarca granosa TaxID=220873 RepID=A0ABQ9EKR2_TEGGR|nr:hypothetical protein KUTeg_016387 [Tegillarca granosa]
MSTKTLDQSGRCGAFHHIIRRQITMTDTHPHEFDDLRRISNLPLNSEGAFGNNLENTLKVTREKHKNLDDLLKVSSSDKKSSKGQTEKRKSDDYMETETVQTTNPDLSVTVKDHTAIVLPRSLPHNLLEVENQRNDSLRMLFPEIPVGGRLTHFLENWQEITNDKWVLSLIQKGYKLEFLTTPDHWGVMLNSRPHERKILPEWDLPIVLNMLRKAPFEPMTKASLKYVTWKIVFLMAITTFKKCGDLQSLQLGEGSVNVQKKVLLVLERFFSVESSSQHQRKVVCVCTDFRDVIYNEEFRIDFRLFRKSKRVIYSPEREFYSTYVRRFFKI